MRQTALDELCGEHVCFYNYGDLERIFNDSGLKIFDVVLNDINGGSIQVWAKRQDCLHYETLQGRDNIVKVKCQEFQDKLDTYKPYKSFEYRCIKLKEQCRKLFAKIKKVDEVVHLLGASTKGNVLLSYFGLTNQEIQFASDRSEIKHGAILLGSNIPIISEKESRERNPDYYFVSIWGFKKEILAREKDYIMNGGSLIFPVPNVYIVDRENYHEHIKL